MEKNTVWAIALSTVVLVGWFAIQTIFFPQPKVDPTVDIQPTETVGTEIANTGDSTEDSAFGPNAKPNPNDPMLSATVSSSEGSIAIPEETFEIECEKYKVTFTNRGGDIIGFELKNHKDSDTGKGVEMVTNVSEMNRAFALSFGGADKPIINDIFESKQIADNKIGFFKKYSMKNDAGENVEFTLIKTYTFDFDEYMFSLYVTIEGGENFTGLDFDGAAYTLRTSPQIGPKYNQRDRYEIREFMSYTDGKKKRTNASPNSTKKFEKPWTWTGIGGKYFCELIYPETPTVMGTVIYSAATETGNIANSQVKATRNAIKVEELVTENPSSKIFNDTYYIFVGPRIDKELNKYSSAEKNNWKLSGTKLNDSLPTSGILTWIEVILKFIMELIYKVIPNWGVAIIILTAILKLAMFPLTKKTAMGTSKLGEIQPQVKALQDKYANNPQKLNEETMKLYKKIGYNPMSGCLPMILQFMILFAMYHLFNNYFEFRGASFIPGWIPDLSKGDHVKTLNFNMPLFGNEIRILPVIYLVSQLFYGKITNNGGTANASQQGSMKFMMYGMPIMFFFLFYNAPSGLLLYWTVSNGIQLGQQLAINKLVKKNKK